ncbi:fructose-1,6-bisphosphatase, cytosolic [Trypanosoma grayi]|uniref:fructose-1,6-bisphosphatase, cytosolic n=1 Tax=Trypanosoma grayi TaxID=71804 RepID=UPI0004F43BA3|nr:fructose-1,6-bisphosphatase, cytosolic [Trypanosoma grayi]KEG14308.1 fructose-1,6-bisphosphatase, cytosolic [Trypanosoma grayi]
MEPRARIPATLTQFMIRSQPSHSRGEFTLLMMAIQTAVKVIEKNIRSAGMQGLFGYLNDGGSNATGDTQAKLDVIANNAFKAYLMSSTCVAFLGSEEEESIVLVESEHQGRYLVFFDPLDGSSNIDANVSVGSIWGIWRLSDEVKVTTPEEANAYLTQLSGNNLVSAGYAMYGSATNLVLTTGHGVDGFTLDSSVGEFIHTHPHITLPVARPIYSVNEGNFRLWDPWFKRYLCYIKEESKKMYTARYIGSMVADVHRTLLYGGIFCYPSDSRKPKGKLRLLYEAAPMAMLMEQAGGKASTGTSRVLDVVPKKLHQRVAVYMGSRHEVDLCLSFQQQKPQQKQNISKL